jgi:Arylsulfotransferase (ASST)
MNDAVVKGLFVLAVLIVGVLYGYLSTQFDIFPAGLLKNAFETADDLGRHWQNDLGLVPTRQIGRRDHKGAGVTVNTDRAQPGLTLLAGFFDGEVGAKLIEADGTIVNHWVIKYTEIWPKRHFLRDAVPLTDWNVFIHGIIALPDGSIVFNFDTGASLVKMDRCGKVKWKLGDGIHHSVFLAEDGTFWVPLGNLIAQISPKGKTLRTINPTAMILKNGLEGIFFIRDVKRAVTHPNDVEVLSSKDAPAFPLFEAGDILYSMRDINLIMVFDPDTEVVKWYQHGPWLRQHDPDFLPDGTISIFNNRMGYGASNIMTIDPVTRETEIIYEAPPSDPRFYTGQRGKHQHLANGNILITATHDGRAFEVTREGEIVWEYINRYDEERLAVISKANRYDRDYFTVQDWSDCDGARVAHGNG